MSRTNWGELCGQLQALEDRVAELEKQAATRSPSPTHDGRIVVDANEWERLIEIESQANAVLEWMAERPTATTSVLIPSRLSTGLFKAISRRR